MAAKRKEQLVDKALDLFYKNGFHATGIDTILAEAKVAKMTLYNNFDSKDDLILAALKKQNDQFHGWLIRFVDQNAETPKGKLLAIFTALKQTFSEKDYHGCLFINAAAEFNDLSTPIRKACSEHKQMMLNYIRDLVTQAGSDDIHLARHLYLLVEGAMVAAQISGRPEVADEAKLAARALISQSLPWPESKPSLTKEF